jgi:hypothetical protein
MVSVNNEIKLTNDGKFKADDNRFYRNQKPSAAEAMSVNGSARPASSKAR